MTKKAIDLHKMRGFVEDFNIPHGSLAISIVIL